MQAPPERRQVFRNELQRVGNEGAKVLKELGSKVKRMEKLGPVDILYEVHEAAEALQKKVDQKSYLLVNSENWEIGKRPKEVVDHQEILNMENEDNKFLEFKSLSETVLDLRSMPGAGGWDFQTPNLGGYCPLPDGALLGASANSQVPQPPRLLSFDAKAALKEEESKTYENASALSLATFTSLLIEFVARLQNIVDAFEELSVKANFKDPVDQAALPPTLEYAGLVARLRRFLML